jgi:hypothetical protein
LPVEHVAATVAEVLLSALRHARVHHVKNGKASNEVATPDRPPF